MMQIFRSFLIKGKPIWVHKSLNSSCVISYARKNSCNKSRHLLIKWCMSKETKRFYSRLAELISDKTHASLPDTSAWIKRKLSFSLIRSSVICIRGSRCHKYKCSQSLLELDIDSNMSQMPLIET